jgi:predicted nucleotidyltransferase
MSYKISSEKIEHPLLKPLLEELIPFFKKEGVKFFVIGATARDIILEINGEQSGRRTQDIDIAITIDKWEKFKEISEELTKLDNFSKDKNQKQRFLYLDKFELDIVPYGEIMEENDKIYWPPDQDFAMTVLGFNEVQKVTVSVTLDDEIEFDVVNLIGIFLLKIVAWRDRNQKENYTELKASSSLIGIDLKELVKDNVKLLDFLIATLNVELEKKEGSILLNQMIETHTGLQFDELYECIQIIVNQLKK